MIPRLVIVGLMLWVGLAFGADLQGLLPDPDKTPGKAGFLAGFLACHFWWGGSTCFVGCAATPVTP